MNDISSLAKNASPELRGLAEDAANWLFRNPFHTKSHFIDSVREYLLQHNAYDNPYVREEDVLNLANQIYHEVNDKGPEELAEDLKASTYLNPKEKNSSLYQKLKWRLEKVYLKLQKILKTAWAKIRKNVFFFALSMMVISFLIIICVLLANENRITRVIRNVSDVFYDAYNDLKNLFAKSISQILNLNAIEFLKSVASQLHTMRELVKNFLEILKKEKLTIPFYILVLSCGLMLISIASWFIDLYKKYTNKGE